MGCEREDVDDDGPAWLDAYGFGHADIGDASDDKVFDRGSGVHVIQHNLLKWFEKVFLEVEWHEFLLHQEFISELSQTVDWENSHVLVGVGADPNEVVWEFFPNFTPPEPDSGHV